MPMIPFRLLLSFTFALALSATSACAQIKIMCRGDSITKAPGDPKPSQSGYRAQLFDDLNKAGAKYQFVGCTVNNSNRWMISEGKAYHNGYGSFRMDQIFQNLDGVATCGGGDDNRGGYWLAHQISTLGLQFHLVDRYALFVDQTGQVKGAESFPRLALSGHTSALTRPPLQPR
jgi:hypothetical protein